MLAGQHAQCVTLHSDSVFSTEWTKNLGPTSTFSETVTSAVLVNHMHAGTQFWWIILQLKGYVSDMFQSFTLLSEYNKPQISV